jgi:hypothetical protein
MYGLFLQKPVTKPCPWMNPVHLVVLVCSRIFCGVDGRGAGPMNSVCVEHDFHCRVYQDPFEPRVLCWTSLHRMQKYLCSDTQIGDSDSFS